MNIMYNLIIYTIVQVSVSMVVINRYEMTSPNEQVNCKSHCKNKISKNFYITISIVSPLVVGSTRSQ